MAQGRGAARAGGGFIKKMLGTLIRPAKRRLGRTSVDVRPGVRASPKRLVSRADRQAFQEADDIARRRIDELRQSSMRQRRRAYVVVGGKNVRTGETAWGQAAGSVRHAEDDVVEKLGGNADDIRFSKSYNVVHERDMPICAPNCQPKYKPHQFPPRTEYDTPGPWDDILDH
jgi:hypothetical protein